MKVDTNPTPRGEAPAYLSPLSCLITLGYLLLLVSGSVSAVPEQQYLSGESSTEHATPFTNEKRLWILSTDSINSTNQNRGGLPVNFTFLATADGGRFRSQPDENFSSYRSGTLGLGISYGRFVLDATAALPGGASLRRKALGKLDLDSLSDTTFVHLTSSRIRVGFAIVNGRIIRIISTAGLIWNGLGEFGYNDIAPQISRKGRLLFAMRAAILFSERGKFKDRRRTRHQILIELGISKWDFSGINFGSGNLISLSVGYLVDVALFSL